MFNQNICLPESIAGYEYCRNMADMELRAFEARLDTMVDHLGEESTELIIERPRYAHAVMVFANGDEPGELLTVLFSVHSYFHILFSFPTLFIRS